LLAKTPFICPSLGLLIHILYDPYTYKFCFKLLDPSFEDRYEILKKLQETYLASRKIIEYKDVISKLYPKPRVVNTPAPQHAAGHFPIPSPTLFENKENKDEQKTPIDFTFPPEGSRWKRLAEWKTRFLCEVNRKQVPYQDF